jgi:pyruvate dehydrogenase E2 component (dihydrolipoamide acetyltransferase)
MANFLLPSLGADMTEGKLVSWKIMPGDVVTRGQVVAEVETDKGVIDVECFDTGVVEKLVAAPGEKLPVGALLAVIHSADESVESPTAAAGTPPPTMPLVATEPQPVMPVLSLSTLPRIRVTPAARKRAEELRVDLAQVHGTGIGGAIELADVEQTAASTGAAVASALPEDNRLRMRRAIATAMSKSKREIPHYYLSTTIEMTRALDWLAKENSQRSVSERLLIAILQLKAVALALREVPELNGYWKDEQFRAAEGVHVGLAISMKGGGLVAPAVHDTDRKSLVELMATLHDLIPRARAGRLRSSEMTDATVTLTNLGDLGVESVYGVIYPPQVAIVGLGKITSQPWAENGAVSVRSVVNATLAADHRASDGRTGAKFLDALNRLLQNPEQL